MERISRVLLGSLWLLVGLLPALANASCGAAFCPVNTQWDIQGAWQEPGLRVDLRYEYLDQDQPRHGRDDVAVGEIPQHHDEIRTINRNWLLGIDYSFGPRWGVSVTVPLVDRDHSHIHHDHDTGLPVRHSWDIEGLGDVRALGRYTLERQPVSLLLGLKLPTGEMSAFDATGDPAERSLLPGTGTTDVLLGVAYRGGAPTSAWSWFGQALLQQPLDEYHDYRPGRRFTLDAGLRYAATDAFGLMAQLNGLVVDRDDGEQAEPDSTGGEFLFLSPGLSYALTPDLQLYGFVQQALHQRVNGVQLTAERGLVIGLSARF